MSQPEIVTQPDERVPFSSLSDEIERQSGDIRLGERDRVQEIAVALLGLEPRDTDDATKPLPLAIREKSRIYAAMHDLDSAAAGTRRSRNERLYSEIVATKELPRPCREAARGR